MFSGDPAYRQWLEIVADLLLRELTVPGGVYVPGGGAGEREGLECAPPGNGRLTESCLTLAPG